ncbi:MAG TPA: nucleotide exchange factor GrpE [Steroidobacter sp.]|jgi:molecular chaperone GrpE|nr:nucleotide exchange factor GrpE [Steroidobacteraceae bacterium]HLS82950.1 nucleotide exchange factor GrpE [Steroidobacter sp.]
MSLPDEQDRPAAAQPAAQNQLGGADAASGAPEAADPKQIEELRAALADAEARAAESKDLYLRALAEADNVRKRAARDIEQAHKYALERFANDLIGVKDSLEMGVASEGSVESLRAGTEATLKLLVKAFENAGLVDIFPQGEMFNPELHEAMISQPSAEHEPNTVLQVIQRGYQLNGRLLRPARVIVAREP